MRGSVSKRHAYWRWRHHKASYEGFRKKESWGKIVAFIEARFSEVRAC